MNSLNYNIVVPVAFVVILLGGYVMLPETSFRIFLVVLATNAVVLAIFFAAIIMLNRQVDQTER
jgi:hypothetical protein